MRSLTLLRKRLLARIYDILILTLILLLILNIFGIEVGFPLERGTSWSVIYISYAIILPLTWKGYVIGKWMNRIRIKFDEKNSDGKKKFFNMVLRELVGFYLIGILTLGLSFIVSAILIAVRDDGKGIHDFIGRTSVVESGS